MKTERCRGRRQVLLLAVGPRVLAGGLVVGGWGRDLGRSTARHGEDLEERTCWSQTGLILHLDPPKGRSRDHGPPMFPLATGSSSENMNTNSSLKNCCEDQVGVGQIKYRVESPKW